MVRIKTPTSRSARFRRYLFNTLAVLLTLELCCRLFIQQQLELVDRDVEAGRSLVKNLDQDIYNYESQRLIHVKTNSLGFRGSEPISPKPSHVCRVVMLGDSYIAALQVESQETMCSQLENLLNEGSDTTRWEVLNFGVTGSGTADQHIRYLKTIRKLEPDVVLVGFGMGTDPVDNNPALSTSPLVHYDLDRQGKLVLIPESDASAKASNFLNQSSHLYVWQKDVTNRLIKSVRSSAGWFDKRDRVYLDPAPEEIAFSWRLSEAILAQYQADVESDGAEFYVVTIPSAVEINRDLLIQLEAKGREAGLTEAFNQDLPLEQISRICRRSGISLIALEPAFRAASQETESNNEALFFNGNGHMNVQGNRIAAEVIAAMLLKRDRSTYDPLRIAEELGPAKN